MEKLEKPGSTLGFSEEELKAERDRIAAAKRKVIADINKINVPISYTVYDHNGTWSMRNVAFWRAIQQKDEKVVEFLEKYLTENK
jgi:hypothetical protein